MSDAELTREELEGLDDRLFGKNYLTMGREFAEKLLRAARRDVERRQALQNWATDNAGTANGDA